MKTPREQLIDLTTIQNANLSILYPPCPLCNEEHTYVNVTLPDGYSWDSVNAGPFSGLAVSTECGEAADTLFKNMYSVIGHPVIED